VLSHPRPPAVYALAALLAGALLLLAPRARSRPVALGAGIAAGGALATLLGGGGILWSGGVPNPLAAHGVAFNVADLAIGAGDALPVGGVLLHAWLHRQRLRDAV
jgi:hypothetical protein